MIPKYTSESQYTTQEADAGASEPLAFAPPVLREEETALPSRLNPHQIAARGFAQTFGLHPAMAFLTVATDLMLHGADIVSAGLLIPISILGGGVIGYITYKSQMKFYGDDDESAKIKALIVAFLTAIPSPLPYMLFIPAGIVGLFRRR